MKTSNFIHERIRSMSGYVPGEQPKNVEIIKLNTNENPFPAPPGVIAALQSELSANLLHKYPDPRSQLLREALARRYTQQPENILVGHGSDEVLALLFRAVLDENHSAVFPNPSYSLYPVLCGHCGATYHEIELDENWRIDFTKLLDTAREKKAPLTIITNPNSPTGIAASKRDLLAFAEQNPGLTLVDEAYVDFGAESVATEAGSDNYPRLLCCNTFSKSSSLAGERIGWLVAHTDFIFELDKLRDSYNLSRLAQVSALAALGCKDEIEAHLQTVISNREWFTAELDGLGFETLPSQANFIFTKPPAGNRGEEEPVARSYFEFLKENNIFIRYFALPRLEDFVRISIGSRSDLEKVITLTRSFYSKS